MPFNENKRFNLNIYDDGPTEGYGSHRTTMGTGMVDDTPYLARMFEKGAAVNNILTPEKLMHFLKRYQGRCVQLPAHTGVDDTVYGSLAMYKKEACELLADWVKNNGKDAMMAAYAQLEKMHLTADDATAFDEILYKMAE